MMSGRMDHSIPVRDARPPTYALSRVELEAAIATLQKASNTFRPTPAEKRLYVILRLCLITAAVGFVATFSGTIVLDRFGDPGMYLLIPGVILIIAAAVAAPVLLVMNIPFLQRVLQQHRILRNTGLRNIARSIRKGEKVRRLGGALLMLVALGFLGLSGLAWYRSHQSATGAENGWLW